MVLLTNVTHLHRPCRVRLWLCGIELCSIELSSIIYSCVKLIDTKQITTTIWETNWLDSHINFKSIRCFIFYFVLFFCEFVYLHDWLDLNELPENHTCGYLMNENKWINTLESFVDGWFTFSRRESYILLRILWILPQITIDTIFWFEFHIFSHTRAHIPLFRYFFQYLHCVDDFFFIQIR